MKLQKDWQLWRPWTIQTGPFARKRLGRVSFPAQTDVVRIDVFVAISSHGVCEPE